MKESELFTPVKKLLLNQGCKDVYGEVCNYDVVGVAPDSEFIVEMKKNMKKQFLKRQNPKVIYGNIPNSYLKMGGGPAWTRTTDLSLIRTAFYCSHTSSNINRYS